MNRKSKLLLQEARAEMRRLSRHPVLSRHWKQVSLVLKGSTSRGIADRYSDIDLVFFTTDRTKHAIVSAYRQRRLCNRSDGIFMLLANGHYHIETYGSFPWLERWYEYV